MNPLQEIIVDNFAGGGGALVTAFLLKYYGTGVGQQLDEPLEIGDATLFEIGDATLF